MTKTKADIELFAFSLRDHLVPFFFNEFKSEETVQMPDLNSKAIRLYRMSSLCRVISLVHSRYEEECSKYDYKIQFVITTKKSVKRYNSMLYKVYKNEFEILEFSKADNNFINGFFEDMFRTAFLYYVSGYNGKENPGGITAAINDFAEQYGLEQLGFDLESLRVLWYRNRNSVKLGRFQNRMANRVHNY